MEMERKRGREGEEKYASNESTADLKTFVD